MNFQSNFEQKFHPDQKLPKNMQESGFQPRKEIHENLAENIDKEISKLKAKLETIEDLPVYKNKRVLLQEEIQNLEVQLAHLKNS